MGTQDFSSRSSYFYSLPEWQSDMVRYRHEVEEAVRKRVGDPLTLAEMECSLDLVEADLAALRSGGPDPRNLMSADLAREIRDELHGLIKKMKLVCKID